MLIISSLLLALSLLTQVSVLAAPISLDRARTPSSNNNALFSRSSNNHSRPKGPRIPPWDVHTPAPPAPPAPVDHGIRPLPGTFAWNYLGTAFWPNPGIFWNLQLYLTISVIKVKASLSLRKHLVITDHVTVIAMDHPWLEYTLGMLIPWSNVPFCSWCTTLTGTWHPQSKNFFISWKVLGHNSFVTIMALDVEPHRCMLIARFNVRYHFRYW